MKLRVFNEVLRFSAFWGYHRKSKYLTFDGGFHNYEDEYEHPPARV